LPGASGVPVHPERLVLDEIPADPDTEPQTSAAQDVGFGRLFRDQPGLALRKNQHAAGQPNRAGHRGQEAQGHERLVKRICLVVERRPAVARGRTEDMVGDLDAGIAEVFGRLRPIANFRRVAADVAGRKEGIEPHGAFPNNATRLRLPLLANPSELRSPRLV
jgi:hypothetical protein